MTTFVYSSSIGRKFIMSISGAFLVLFLTFHAVMNSVALISADAYNWICAVLGVNWYAIIGTAVLAGGVAVHILYGLMLTLQNRRARGKQRYAVEQRSAGVAWSAKNMFVLGLVVLGGLAIHLVHFWSKMQFAELMGSHENSLGIHPQDGAAMIAFTFSKWYNVAIYLAWFAAIWLHLTHGMWSMMQSSGLDNQKWLPRIKCIGNIWATLIMGLFALVAVVFFVKSLI